MENKLISGLKREDFQAMVQGKETDLYTLTNAQGMEVSITNYGGSLVSIMVPDRDGNICRNGGEEYEGGSLYQQFLGMVRRIRNVS